MLSLECVPNVSEGRRPEVVARLAAVASSPPGVRLLDVSSDPDHNRSVLTLAGEPEGLHRGLLALYEAALAEIDLTRHQGVHPRVGAVDVVPFVPLGDTPMATAVAAAGRLAPEVARRFGLPVYLYERAARRPERTALANIGEIIAAAASRGWPGSWPIPPGRRTSAPRGSTPRPARR